MQKRSDASSSLVIRNPHRMFVSKSAVNEICLRSPGISISAEESGLPAAKLH